MYPVEIQSLLWHVNSTIADLFIHDEILVTFLSRFVIHISTYELNMLDIQRDGYLSRPDPKVVYREK